MSDFVSVPGIVLIVYLLAEGYKWLINGSERWMRLLPVVCGLAGGILGLVCFFALPGFIGADNALTAAAIGITSGFAATGANQVFKQLAKNNDSYDDSVEGGI